VQSIKLHEGGKKHKNNVQLFLANQEKEKVKERIKAEQTDAAMRKIELAAVEAMRAHGSSVPIPSRLRARVKAPPPPPPPPAANAAGGPLDAGRDRYWGGSHPPSLPDRHLPASVRERRVAAASATHSEPISLGDAMGCGLLRGSAWEDVRPVEGPSEEEAAFLEATGAASDGEASVVYLCGAGAAVYLRAAGQTCEVRRAGGGVWEEGEVMRVNDKVTVRSQPRFMVRVGAGLIREVSEADVRLRLGDSRVVDAARARGIDPAVVVSGAAMREEGGWRRVTLVEMLRGGGGKRPRDEAAESEDDSKRVKTEDETAGDMGAWQTVATREITEDQAEAEAHATIEDMALGTEDLQSQVLGGGDGRPREEGVLTSLAIGEAEERPIDRLQRLVGEVGARVTAEAEPLSSEAPAATFVKRKAVKRGVIRRK
jgi:hypothetical protein